MTLESTSTSTSTSPSTSSTSTPRKRTRYLTPEIRELIWKSSYQLKIPQKTIALQYNVSTRTVKQTLKNYRDRGVFETRKSSGRPPIISKEKLYSLYLQSCNSNGNSNGDNGDGDGDTPISMTYDQLRIKSGINVSTKTLARNFNKAGYKKVKVQKRKIIEKKEKDKEEEDKEEEEEEEQTINDSIEGNS